MKNWFRNLGYKMQSFMYGRYGQDDLSRFLSIAALVLIVLDLFLGTGVLSWLGLFMCMYSIFRMYSKKRAKRQRELEAYLKLANPVKNWFGLCKRKWSDRKTHCYFTCPSCKKTMRVPKGKGKIKITCPECKTQITKTT